MTLQPEYFDRLYEQAEDPWSFRTRWYEARKRELTLASLPKARYRSVFEPGCSIGVLTAGLALRADRVLAMDPSIAALGTARRARPPNVDLIAGTVPAGWPPGRWDLVVLSELGYYLDRDACAELGGLAAGCAGDLVLVHWRHPVDDYPLAGDEVHDIVGAAASAAGLCLLATHVEDDFRLDVWSSDGRSVARRTDVPGATAGPSGPAR
jgi:SAM-dependent methyltransferase